MRLIIVGSDVSYAKVGALLVGDGDQLEQARQRLAARRGAAPEIGEVALLDDRQARELFPPLRPDAAALFIPGAARVDGRRLAAALIRAATRLGAVTSTGEAKLTYRPDRAPAEDRASAPDHAACVTGVTVDGERLGRSRRIRADHGPAGRCHRRPHCARSAARRAGSARLHPVRSAALMGTCKQQPAASYVSDTWTPTS